MSAVTPSPLSVPAAALYDVNAMHGTSPTQSTENTPCKSTAIKVGVVTLKLFSSVLVLTVVGPLLLLGSILTAGKLWNSIVGALFLPAASTAKDQREPAQLSFMSYDEHIKNLLRTVKSHRTQNTANATGSITSDSIKIPLPGKGALDGKYIKIDDQAPTVIYFCPNMARYDSENGFDIMTEYAHQGCNVLMFNYQSVGLSEGAAPQCGQDLIDNGTAVIEHAITKLGIAKEHMILHGHSIGGAVATMVARKYPEAHLYNERSFTKFSDAAAGIVNKYSYLGSLFGAILSHSRWELNPLQAFEDRNKLPNKGFSHFVTALRDEIIAEEARIGDKAKNIEGGALTHQSDGEVDHGKYLKPSPEFIKAIKEQIKTSKPSTEKP